MHNNRNLKGLLLDMGFEDNISTNFYNLRRNNRRSFCVYTGGKEILGSYLVPSYNSTHHILSLMIL